MEQLPIAMSLPVIAAVIILVIIIIFILLEPKWTKPKVSTKNNEHGSARFATTTEIKKTFREEKVNSIEKSGMPMSFSKDLNKVYFDNETPHWICIGSTGSGKSVTSVIPQCSFIASAKKKRSCFITDPKGEIFSKTSTMFEKNGYDILTIDFRNPEYSTRINILEPVIKLFENHMKYEKLSNEEIDENKKITYLNMSIKNLADCNLLINTISSSLLSDESAKEQFFNSSGKDLLYGLIQYFLEEYREGKIRREQITLPSIKKFQNSTLGDFELKTFKNIIEKRSIDMYPSTSKLKAVIFASENTFKSISAVFNERMSIFDDTKVENVVSVSDFSFNQLAEKQTVLYFIIPDEDKTYYSLVSLIVSLIYKELVLVCNNSPEKKLPVEVSFILDEFANTPQITDITSIVSVARSRGMQFIFYIQSFAQLDIIYGKDTSLVLQDNCGLIYLKTNTFSTAEIISKKIGNKTIESHSVNYSPQTSLFSVDRINNTQSLMSRNVLTPDEIMHLVHKTIILPTRGNPIFRDTYLYDKFSCYISGAAIRNERPLKNMNSTYYLFNIKRTPFEKVPLTNDNKKIDELYSILQAQLNVELQLKKIDMNNSQIIPVKKPTKVILKKMELFFKSENYNFEYDSELNIIKISK